jgi:hypothetical protein
VFWTAGSIPTAVFQAVLQAQVGSRASRGGAGFRPPFGCLKSCSHRVHPKLGWQLFTIELLSRSSCATASRSVIARFLPKGNCLKLGSVKGSSSVSGRA